MFSTNICRSRDTATTGVRISYVIIAAAQDQARYNLDHDFVAFQKTNLKVIFPEPACPKNM
jgi:hypothetical protein